MGDIGFFEIIIIFFLFWLLSNTIILFIVRGAIGAVESRIKSTHVYDSEFRDFRDKVLNLNWNTNRDIESMLDNLHLEFKDLPASRVILPKSKK